MKRLVFYLTTLCLSLATSSVADVLVDLDARDAAEGPIPAWRNEGALGKMFEAGGSPVVTTIDGVKGVTYDGASRHVGPRSIPSIEGSSPRSIQAWIYNPEIAGEETVVSWAHRGGPDGTNMSFNHGTHNAFGAVGHWGNGPDIGWDPAFDDGEDVTETAQEEAAIWTNIGYAQTGTQTRVYTNGVLTKMEDIPVDTHPGQVIVIAAQQTGANSGAFEIGGTLTVATARIYDEALTDDYFAFYHNVDAESFGRPLAPITDADGDTIPDSIENQYAFLNLNSAADADLDEDDDGLSNLLELEMGLDPGNADTDGDGVSDGDEVNRAEGATSPHATDSDGDTLSDGDEAAAGTDPLSTDTDGDGVLDNIEIDLGSDPLDPTSTPNAVVLSNSTTSAAQSWNTASAWSDGEQPQAGKQYSVNTGGASFLQSPSGAQSTFAGDSLSLAGPEATLLLRNTRSTTITQLQLRGGILRSAPGNASLFGSIAVMSESTIDTVQGSNALRIAASVSGTETLHLEQALEGSPGQVEFAGDLTQFAGDLVVQQSHLSFATPLAVGGGDITLQNGVIESKVNVLLPATNLVIDGNDFSLIFNGKTMVFGSLIGIDASGAQIFSLPVGTYTSEDLRSTGFNEEQIVDDGVLIILGEDNDSDSDGLPDEWETENIGDLSADGETDTDGDGLNERLEYIAGSDSNEADTDGDGLSDGDEVLVHNSDPSLEDSDGDGLTDSEEINRMKGGEPAPTNPTLEDSDGDGLSDAVETDTGSFVDENDTGTDPLVADTDGDGWSDGDEVSVGTDPTDSEDVLSFPAGTRVAIDATELPEGPLSDIENLGTLGGSFVAEGGDVVVTTVDGIPAITLDGIAFMRGPVASEDLVDNSSRSIEAWIYNPSIASEETVVAWGRRGGPAATNMAFNHGTHNAFGAVGHWDAPDIGWDSAVQADDAVTETGEEEAGVWTFIAYTYDSQATRTSVYTNGQLTNTEDIGPLTGGLSTFAVDSLENPLNIILGSQVEADGTPTAALRGSMSIAKLTISARTLSPEEIESHFTADAEFFGRADSDSDGLSDAWEMTHFENLNETAEGDPDGDGLDNLGEFTAKTDPNESDTDGDGASDGEEVAAFTNPLNADDFPNKEAVLLVDLDATELSAGPIATWENQGDLGGSFAATGEPQVTTIDGVNGVELTGANWLVGPLSVPGIEGRSARTAEAWIYNPDIADEETILSWSRRGGPAGTNVSFNHGVNATFGAVGHWDAPDIGWNGTQEAAMWTYVVYTYDGSTTRVYTNGVEANSEANIILNTHADQEIVIGAQREPNGIDFNTGLTGTMSIAKVRIWDQALAAAEIASAYNENAEAFGREPLGDGSAALVSLDSRSLPAGPLGEWPNTGTVGGVFTAAGDPVVETIDGVPAVTLDGDGDWFVGPAAPAVVTGSNPRTITAWIKNPTPVDEETIFSWGSRGGPDGSNVSFNHGVNDVYGAVGHWGGSDIGWNNNEEIDLWTHVAYTQDGTTTNVYTNGFLSNTETPITLATNGADTNGNPLPFVVGNQNEADGTQTNALVGGMSIAVVNVYGRALTQDEVRDQYNEAAESFGRTPYTPGEDSDGDGLPDDYEIATFGNLDQTGEADADGDSLSNLQEFELGSDPLMVDTDRDGYTDGDEGAAGSDPVSAASYPASPTNTLVELNAIDLTEGPITSWSNAGTLGGEFIASGDPAVETIDGVKGVTLDGDGDWLVGPDSIPLIEGASARTIEAWVYNPAVADEETVVSWGRRGGPDATNVSFNHGANDVYGAVGHWGGSDIGWANQEEASIWTHIAYTQNGIETRVYTNGILSESESPITLNTHSSFGIVVGGQWEPDGVAVNGALLGSLSIASLRIYDDAVSAADLAMSYNEDAAFFGRPPISMPTTFNITSVVWDESGNLVFSWPTTEGTTYTIQYSTSLESEDWIDIGTIDGDGNMAEFTDSDAARLASGIGFYRVAVNQ